MKPVQIQGKDYYLNLADASGSTKTGDVNVVIELYDEEPTFTNNEASVEPAQTFHCYGDAGAFYYALKPAVGVLEATRSW